MQRKDVDEEMGEVEIDKERNQKNERKKGMIKILQKNYRRKNVKIRKRN